MAIERAEFLQMCQKVSMLKNGVCEIKEKIFDDLKVVYNDIVYYPIGYELHFEMGQTKNIAILHDLNANSTTHADLERIDKYEQTRNNCFD